MNRILLALCSLVLIFTACQKETSFEKPIPAEGSLQDDLGDCMPSLVNGIYTTGSTLADSNSVIISVIVTKPGAYTITTDTVNGYSFKATGTFNAVDTFPVVLKGMGKPSVAGTDRFTVRFSGTFCAFDVDVVQGTGGGGGTAVYTLNAGTTPGSCSTQVNGSYAVGTATNASNTVVLNVNVTTVGSWSISTSVAGITFSGAGTFLNTGNNQTITLNASGTPTTGGTQNFSVTAGSSTCTFPVIITGGTTPPPAGVYFPLTLNSYWTYDTGTDTLKTTNVGNVTLGGTGYSRFVTVFQGSAGNDTSHYRKSTTNAYFRRVDTAGLGQYGLRFTTSSFDVEFLRDVLTQGQALTTTVNANFQPAGSPLPLAAQVKFISTCIDANATVTSSLGVTFNNVYEVETVIEVVVSGLPFPVPLPNITNWYARNVGLIGSDDGTDIQEIRYWRVN